MPAIRITTLTLETSLLPFTQASSTGQDLLDVVIKHLNLLETSYFGLKYLETPVDRQATSGGGALNNRNNGNPNHPPCEQVWLDVNKSAIKQLRDIQPMTVYFGVKYYAPDPCKLAEEITRYQFFLQCKQDILHSRLPVTLELAIELFALAVQSELGDYDPQRHQDGYVGEFQFLPNQSMELEKRVALFHRNLTGQVPATAELNFLERVKWLDLYGCELHPIQYDENSNEEYSLGLNPSGVLVLRNKLKVAQYHWRRIIKTKCQGRCFLMDVMDHSGTGGKGTAERNRFGFRLPDKEASRKLRWSVEDHKSFHDLIHSSATLSQLAQRQLQQQQHLKLSQRFRNSIRSAINVGHLGGMQLQLAQQQKLRSSMKSLNSQQHYALDARSPPTVVRMPSRRYSNRSLNRPAAYSNNLPTNGLPHVQQQVASSQTMVESQRQQAIFMMNQFNQMNGMIGKSQTLKPVTNHSTKLMDSKEAKRNPYYQMMMMMAAANQHQQQAPEVAILPPGRHIVQPSIYRASSVLNGLGNMKQQQQFIDGNNNNQVPPMGSAMMQFFNTKPQYPGYHANGHESPRSTKSAIAPISALKLASKKLAKQQQQLLYNNRHQHQDVQPLLAYDPSMQQQQQQGMYGSGGGPYYGIPSAYNLSTSANPSPRSARSARIASRHKSKSTNENLHLLHQQENQIKQHYIQANADAKFHHPQMDNKMLLATTQLLQQQQQQQQQNMAPPPPRYHHGSGKQSSRHLQHLNSDNESELSKVSRRSAGGALMNSKKRATFALNNEQANLLLNTNGLIEAARVSSKENQMSTGNQVRVMRNSNSRPSDDDDYCCSRSDCSSVDDGGPEVNSDCRQRNLVFNQQQVNRKVVGAQKQPIDQQQRRRRNPSTSTISCQSNSYPSEAQQVNQNYRSRNPQSVPIDEQQEWNAIRKRHHEFSSGKGFLTGNLLQGQRHHQQQVTDQLIGHCQANNNSNGTRRQIYAEREHEGDGEDSDLNNNTNNNNDSSNNNAHNSSQLVKSIANKQATPILLSLNYDHTNANNKAVQLLNLQRQQLNSQSSDAGTKSSSSAADSAPSSVASSPKATGGGAVNQVSGSLSVKSSKTTDSTASSSSTTTSGYYAGSNSTGSASVDSDSHNTLDGPQQSLLAASANKQPNSKASLTSRQRPHQSGGAIKTTSGYQSPFSDWHDETGSRAKIALGSYSTDSARMNGTNRLLIGGHQKQQLEGSPGNVDSIRHQQQQQNQNQQHFYLGETGKGANDCQRNQNQVNDLSQQWSSLNQIQQHAPSSLKYVSFDV